MRMHALISRSARRSLGLLVVAAAAALVATPASAHGSAPAATNAALAPGSDITAPANSGIAAADTAGSADKGDLASRMAGTVKANPGSKQIAKNVIQLDEGIIMVLATDDKSAQSASSCPSGWQCAWPHVNFGGDMLAAQRCVYLNYFQWAWRVSPGVYDDFAYDVSSVFNNIPGVTWSQFWSPRNNANYNAHVGSPASYVGDKWNDSFTAAQGCAGDPA